MGISRPSNAAASQTTLKLGSDRSSTSPLDASDSMDRHAHSVGLATNRGGKNTHEDAYFIGGTLPDRMTLNGYSAQNMGGCFGIFDGHGGDRASRFCAEYLFPRIAEELTHTSDVGKAMIAAVRAVDAEFCEICVSVNQAHLARAPTVFGLPSTVYQTHRMEDGSTCLIAMIRDGVLYVGNVGDSRAILSTKAGDFVSMSIDQKPDRKDERERLEARGAKVTGSPSFMYKVWPFHKFLDVPRVNGALAMSRSIGDRSLKSWIICDPEITTHQIRPEDRFLIMATDGLWDVVPSKIAARVAATTTNPQVLAEVLLKMALERKSYDNVTVLVVDVQTYMVASAGT
ncbi:TPA: hypothetical protein N0F65_000079 [Lagenidium giganteum]|uniref:PPM-type phosphatase domain-containing protein n=1 Tax=Lagenidium giganteum TaxID=4803 RepID=A0AAV2YJF8_9STRA|nr:TPA: hypothetical protein N0F65_000079 [Lagenidium giganteum]